MAKPDSTIDLTAHSAADIDSLPAQYNPKSVEPVVRSLWEESNAFHANPTSGKPAYSITMPPPNVTGVLHMGHALVNTLQDILIRWKKMQGFEVLWMPGTDHAGIATQTVVERHLLQSEGKRRADYPREQFLEKVWDWKEKSQNRILNQLKALGCACDWKRLRFTMDSGSNIAVNTMFKRLFDAGLIYKGDYLVNWDPVAGTALADDEVEYEDRQGFLYTIRYPIQNAQGQNAQGQNSQESILVATTRPETLLGDTAVAVHPKDARYAQYIGSMISHPITGRSIPILADDFVDPEFGTGAVKITPGHDPNDYQMALRHNLPMINILNPDGTLNEAGLHYAGQSTINARANIVEELAKQGLLAGTTPHMHRVGISYRSKAVIEPMLSKQWFVRLSSFKKELRTLVEEKQVEIIPHSWEQTYFQWIDNLRDWCISRQIWWGHQIPIWYNKADRSIMICHDREGLPTEVAQNPDQWEQDPDVLDTWFSSALWPFSTLGWPEKTPELAAFYPNSTLITGHDILFFWVARMIMMGQVGMKQVPFRQTFLHGLIYGKSYWRTVNGAAIYVSQEERKEFDLGKTAPPKDVHSRWEKMSKSKGNVLDPIEIIDEYGTDAMRLTLASSATGARQIDLDRRKFEEWRNFANKVWNGARFVLMNIRPEDLEALRDDVLPAETLEDRWILSRLQRTAQNVSRALETYAFDKAAHIAYAFYWDEFCAYYLELIKPALFGKRGETERRSKLRIALTTLVNSIKILHPFAPYITEEIFQLMKKRFGHMASPGLQPGAFFYDFTKNVLAESAFPQDSLLISDETEAQFTKLCDLISSIRAIRGEMKIPPGYAIQLFAIGKSDSALIAHIRNNLYIIEAMTKIASCSIQTEAPSFAVDSRAAVDDVELVVPLPDQMRAQELLRLEKELLKLLEQKEKTERQLANPKFVERAPKELVEELQAALRQQEQAVMVMSQQKARLGTE